MGLDRAGELNPDRRLRRALAVAVALVLADSSVVVLALPEIYRELDVSVTAVTWVLVAFNLVLALAALPAASAARRFGPGRVALAGLLCFGLASLICGLAGSIGLLLAARCAQAIGGAGAVCASLELLPSAVGSERRAATIWAASGALGAALGPGIGGLLTELISWQSIFFVQVPGGARLRRRPRPDRPRGALPGHPGGRTRARRSPAPGRERGAGADLGGAGRGAVLDRPAA